MSFRTKHFQSPVMSGTVRLSEFMGNLPKDPTSDLPAQVESVTVQAQDGDVRYVFDGSEVTGVNGVILADGAQVEFRSIDFDEVLFFPVIVNTPKISGHFLFP